MKNEKADVLHMYYNFKSNHYFLANIDTDVYTLIVRE